MPNINNVVLVGHLASDPEVKYLQSGTAVLECTLAVNDRVKRGEEWVDEASFIDCTIWNRQAEYISENCAKGDCISVEGKLKQERWENQEGEKRSKIKVVALRSSIVKTKGT